MFSSPSSGSASASIGVFTKSYRFSALRFLRNSPFCRPFTRLIPNSMNSKILTSWFYSTSNRTLVMQYRFATPKRLKRRSPSECCATAPLRNPLTPTPELLSPCSKVSQGWRRLLANFLTALAFRRGASPVSMGTLYSFIQPGSLPRALNKLPVSGVLASCAARILAAGHPDRHSPRKFTAARRRSRPRC